MTAPRISARRLVTPRLVLEPLTVAHAPEMVEVLKAAGICNYTIFADGDELFGYYECARGVAFAERTQAESAVVDRWNACMADILELVMDPATGAQPKLEPVFRLD